MRVKRIESQENPVAKIKQSRVKETLREYATEQNLSSALLAHVVWVFAHTNLNEISMHVSKDTMQPIVA